MAAPRLSGAALRVTRSLVSNPAIVAALWPVLSRDFHIGELARLPATDRDRVPPGALPTMAAPARRWASEEAAPTEGVGARLRERWAAGTSSPSALLEAVLQRGERGPFANAHHSPLIAVDAARARADAAASTERWQHGAPLGPLDGVPIPVKDELDLVGTVTRGGTSYRREVATADAAVVAQLRAAGAVVYAKTHATEWGMNALGQCPHLPLPRNPWRAGYAAGGSSTGSGVAVAMGLAPSAVGSDGGGSIRIPAAFNGVWGLKPTYVRVSRVGNLWGGGTMAHLGPIASTMEDLVELLRVIGTPDPADPWTNLAPAGASTPLDWRAALRRGVRGARIGVLRQELADAEAPVAAACEAGLRALEAAGALLVDVDLPLAKFAPAIGALTILSETRAGVVEDIAAHGGALSDDLATVLALITRVSAADLLDAQRLRAGLRRQTAALLAHVDLLAMPTTSSPPEHPVANDGVSILDAAASAAATRFVFFGNLLGLPAGSAPVGRPAGLPVGLQLIGDAWDEASVIAAMATLERRGPWDGARPEGWLDLTQVV